MTLELGRVLSRPLGRERAESAAGAPDLGAVYDAYAGPLYRYLVTFFGGAEEAEDALQEVFLGLVRRPIREPIRDLRHYLFRAAHNQALMVLRRRKHQGATEDSLSWIDPQACAPGDCELAMDIDRALRQLPSEQREVVALKVGEDLTFREIAEALGVPQNTAASRYRLALARLRALLEGGDGNE